MAAFPKIGVSNTIISQFPYTEIDEWIVSTNELDCGIAVTLSQNQNALRKFVLTFDTITRAELTILESFWDSMRGPAGEFDFTDDHGAVWHHTHFDQQRLDIKYPEVGRFSVQIKLRALENTATGGEGPGSSL